MADKAQGVPALPPPPGPAVPQALQAPAILPAPQAPQASQVPQAPEEQPFVHLNWSNFKSEYSGKPNEDAEVHLLSTNDWMNAHHFVEGVRVQKFHLTLLGEARSWYHSLKPMNVNWQELQNLFRQQYSKIGNTREQLFHVWRSFNFDENEETIDAYVTQVATPLGYGEPEILEMFKNTLPTKLYWILFPIEDLRQVVETAKRIITKEKLDKQLAGQLSSTPFMSINDGHHRKVSFDTRNE